MRELAQVLGCALTFALAACASAPQARAPAADPIVRFELHWNAADGCMDEATARQAIARSLRSPEAARGAVVRVTISNAGDAWNADVWLYGPRGSGDRTARGTNCKQLAEAVTLMVALALDGPYVAELPRRPVASAPEVESSAEFELGVSLASDRGSLPAVSAGLGVSVELTLSRWRLGAEGSAWLPRRAPGGPVPSSGGSIGLYAGGLRTCFDALAADDGRLRFGPCLAAEAGAAVGRGYGIEQPEGEENFWAAGAGGIAMRYLGVGSLRLGLLAELGVPLHRSVWQIEGVPVFQAASWFGRASIRIGYVFR